MESVVYCLTAIIHKMFYYNVQNNRKFKCQISEALQEAHGYAPMTDALRARIFGLNAARVYGIDVEEVLQRAGSDRVGQQRAEYRAAPDPHFLTFGPTTKGEFAALLKARGGPL